MEGKPQSILDKRSLKRERRALECDAPAKVRNALCCSLVADSRRDDALIEMMEQGDVLARGPDGSPLISRLVDPKMGTAKTIVIGHGAKQAYGETTVRSLLDASSEKTRRWLKTLTNHQARGLVHEIGQRLVEQSQAYHLEVKELKRLKWLLGFAYFGLSTDAPEKDLDAAYKSFAKKMHPDKNGGSEESKQRFQVMKERYEGLKDAIRSREGEGDVRKGSDGCSKHAAAECTAESGSCYARQILDGRPPPSDTWRKEAYNEDDNDESHASKDDERRTSQLSYDPSDRDSIIDCMRKMLERLKSIQPHQEILSNELDRVTVQLSDPSCAK
jgi:hypothetical protein